MNAILTRCLRVALFCIAVAIPRPSYAIVATQMPEHPQAVFSTQAEYEVLLGRKLSWQERIGLKIVNWKIKKKQATFQTRLWQPADSTNCGRIALKDGTVIDAQILAISATEVRYKRCGKPNDPEMIELKTNILSVVAADGGFLFKNTGNPTTAKTTKVSPAEWDGKVRTEANSVWSIVYGVLGWLGVAVGAGWTIIIGAVGAVIWGGISLRRIRENPERFKPESKVLAYLGIVSGGILLLLLVVGLAALAAV